MSISPISAASLGQYVLSTGNPAALQHGLQTLQDSLASGDLNSATAALQSVRTLFQNTATASGASLPSQLSTDLAALGTALNAGDLSTAQSAFATIQNDLKNGLSPAQASEANAASQSEQLVAELLGSLNSSSSSYGNGPGSPDLTTSVLDQVYGTSGALNVHV
jgi:hypothetical protein